MSSSETLLRKIRRLMAAQRYTEIVKFSEQFPHDFKPGDETSHLLAHALINLGRWRTAAEILEGVALHNPAITQIKADLCKLHILANAPEKAAPLFEAIKADASRDFRNFGLLGDVYLQAGRAAEAYEALKAFSGESEEFLIQISLAEAALRIGLMDEGVHVAMALIARFGVNKQTMPVAGIIALLQKEERLSSQCNSLIEKMAPDQGAQLADQWASVLIDGEYMAEAVEAAALAARLSPTSARYRRLGDLHLSTRELDGAIEAANAALALDKIDPQANALLARCMIVRGDIDIAKEILLSVIKEQPDCVNAYDYLAQIDAAAITGPMLAKLHALVETNPHAADLSKLLLTLARLEEDRGSPKKAFEYIVRGKSLIAESAAARGRKYQPQKTERLLNTLSSIYAKPSPIRLKRRDVPRMVFIVGMPRSGTSLIEQILASHPEVFAAGEVKTLPQILEKHIRSLLPRKDQHDPQVDDHLSTMADAYRDSLPQKAQEFKTCTDKHPLNFWSIGLIKSLFPESKILHIKRDPVDTCLSILRTRFIESFSCANEVSSVTHYYACYELMMTHWRSVYESEIFTVEYESLLQSPEPWSRAIIKECNLDWRDECLNFHTLRRPVYTHSATQVREEIHQRTLDRRKKYGAHLLPLEKALAHYRKTLGVSIN